MITKSRIAFSRVTRSRALAVFVSVAMAVDGTAARAGTAMSFAEYVGSWVGSGQIALAGGNVESLRYKGYYTLKDDGRGLGLVLRCASPSNMLELRSQLVAGGEKITGVWEERTFNATGNVTGMAAAGRLDLAIEGAGFGGSMQVVSGHDGQKVSIQTDGIAVKSINISFARMGGAS